MHDFRLIAITPDETGSRLIDACRAAEAGGATAIQVRRKSGGAGELLRITTEIIRAVGLPVFVNDRADVARAAGAAGVHFGWDDFPSDLMRQVAPRPLRLGVSVGDEAEATDAERADADYWSVGPFFATLTKPDAGTALGDSGFRRLVGLAPPHMPVIAIGGITAANVTKVVAAGAAGVAVVREIFSARQVEVATRALRDALDRALH